MNLLDLLSGLLLSLLWGGNYAIGKIGVEYLSPSFLLAICFIIIAIISYPFASWEGRRNFINLLIASSAINVVHLGLLFSAIKYGLNSAEIIACVQLNVPITAILAYFIYKENLSIILFAAIITAFIGFILIFQLPDFVDFKGFSLIIGASLAQSCYNIYAKKISNNNNGNLLFWSSLVAFPQLLIYSHCQGNLKLEFAKLTQINWQLFWVILYNALTSILSLLIWNRLVKNYSIARVSFFSLLAPIFSIIIARIVFAEQLTNNQLIGITLILSASAMIIKPPQIRILTDQIKEA